MADSFITFRLDETLKARFEQIAKDKDLTTSQLLRAYIRGEVERNLKENKQPDLFKETPSKPRNKKKRGY